MLEKLAKLKEMKVSLNERIHQSIIDSTPLSEYHYVVQQLHDLTLKYLTESNESGLMSDINRLKW